MNKIEIEKYRNKLEELGKFTLKKNEYKGGEIINWISECASLFAEIGVNNIILDNFLKYFSYGTDRIELDPLPAGYPIIASQEICEKVLVRKTIGPFIEKITYEGYLSYPVVQNGIFELNSGFYYAKIAFANARAVLKKRQNEEIIVAKWMIDKYLDNDRYDHIVSSLKLIEENYQEKNAEGMTSNAMTLLDGVLNFDEDLVKKQKLGGKLNAIIEDEDKRKKFGVSKDLVSALRSIKVIRNEKVAHKDVPLKYDIPFQVAVSFTYLVLFFVEVVTINGDFIE